MDVDMQVDTPSQMPASAQTIANALLLLLRDALHTFIRVQIARALGENMLATFAPSATATELDLLHFIDKKWLSVFSDSPLSEHKHSIHRLSALAKCTPFSKPVCGELARLVESVLISIAPSRAARAADLRRCISPASLSKHSPIGSSPSRPSSLPASQSTNHHQARTHQARAHQAGANHALPHARAQAQAQASDTAALVNSALARAPAPTLAYALAVNHAPGMKNELPLPIVLDGSNIAWRHGKSSYFSMRGVILALQFYLPRVCDVALFLPEARLEPQHRDADAMSYDEIHALKGSKHLVLTPANDYDDAYMCSFARKHAAAIVSNDEFRDHVYQASADGERCEREWSQWLQACRVSFTFCQDEFVPYPAFNWTKAASVASQLRFP